MQRTFTNINNNENQEGIQGLIQHSNNDSTVERGIPNLYDGGQDLVLRFEPNAPTILTSPSPTTVQANPSATSGVVAETPRPQVITNDQTGFRWTWLAWVVGALSVLTMVVRIRAKR